MTVEHAYQFIKEHFPNTELTLFINKLNRAVNEFVQETDCVIQHIIGTVSGTTITITSPAAQTLTNIGSGDQIIYAIPTYAYNIREIRFADSRGQYIDSPVTYVIDSTSIQFFTTEGEPLTSWPSTVYYIEFIATKAPAALTATTDTISIPDQFCEALTARILMDLYTTGVRSTPEESAMALRLAAWHREEYLRIRREAKKFGNWQRDRTVSRGMVGELLASDSITTETSVNTGESSYDDGVW